VAIAKVSDADEVMLTTTRGILIRTPVADMRLIGRNTQGVRLIRVEEGDSVSSLAKLPEEELGADELDVDTSAPDNAPVDGHAPHILDDGVGGAEASDHIDDLDADGEPDA
jgi:DNA gyrase subunit A